MLRFAVWMNGSYWQHQEVSETKVHDYARRYLYKLARRFTQSSLHLTLADAGQLHTLRIFAKKLRYSTEFFSMLYTKKKVQPFIAALSEVQDALGQINDVAVAHRLLDDLALTSDLSAYQESFALAKGWIAHDLSHQFVALQKAIRHLAKQKKFWS